MILQQDVALLQVIDAYQNGDVANKSNISEDILQQKIFIFSETINRFSDWNVSNAENYLGSAYLGFIEALESFNKDFMHFDLHLEMTIHSFLMCQYRHDTNILYSSSNKEYWLEISELAFIENSPRNSVDSSKYDKWIDEFSKSHLSLFQIK